MITTISFPFNTIIISSKDQLKEELTILIERIKDRAQTTYIIDTKLLDGRKKETVALYFILQQTRKWFINFIFIGKKEEISDRIKAIENCKTELKFKDLITGKELKTCELWVITFGME